MTWNRKLILDDGSEYPGTGFGGKQDVVCEVVFNTSMTGYQEILSDPSYTDQAVVMSYPLIGNYGITNEDYESRMISVSALLVRDINETPSNFRSVRTVPDLLEEQNIPGIYGIDTRRLVRRLRNLGSRRGLVTDVNVPAAEGLERIQNTPIRHDAVKRCSCRRRWYSRTSNPLYQVVVIDCGMKLNMVKMLNQNKCNVTVVPSDTTAKDGIEIRRCAIMNGITMFTSLDTVRILLEVLEDITPRISAI